MNVKIRRGHCEIELVSSIDLGMAVAPGYTLILAVVKVELME